MAPMLRGSGQEVGQLPEFECTYADCSKRFHTEKEMIGHKLNEPEHNYCKKCKHDAKDWQDLTQHKVAKMIDFVNDRDRSEGASPKHITCEFCGEDFKSFGGRKGHRNQMHPAEQSLQCPAKDQGCYMIFTRAAFLIQHLEEGECEFISAYDFRASVQHKHVLKEIMQNPGQFTANLQINKKYAMAAQYPGLVTDGVETQDQEDGGVSILDQHDDEQERGHTALEAEKDFIDFHAVPTREKVEQWPRMQPPQITKEALQKLTLETSIVSIDSGSEYGSSATSRRKGQKVRTESFPSLSSPVNGNSSYNSVSGRSDTSDAASDATATPSPDTPAWSNGRTTAKVLFKSILKKPSVPVAPGDYGAHFRRREQEDLAAKSQSNNILYSHFYDPGSPDYNPDLFFSSVMLKYCCPFPSCGDDKTTYETPSDIAVHLQHAHLRRGYVCTTCYKRFKSATALTAHLESASVRCRVKDSNNYERLLDEISGGFLKGRVLVQPMVCKPEPAVVKAGQKTQASGLKGVMQVEFEAKMPHRA